MSGWFLIGYATGIVTNLIIEFVSKRKRHRLEKIQPSVEVYGKNYKKFDKVV
jgi:hypothetical protein